MRRGPADHRAGRDPGAYGRLDVPAWDLLNLLTCAPGSIADDLMTDLGVTLPALRSLDEAKLIRRDARGVAFRHDLCRRAVSSVIPPGAEPGLHRRFIERTLRASHADPAVLTHHALGAGDKALTASAAAEAGRRPPGRCPHPGIEFFEIALEHGGLLARATEAELLELVADEYYLVDRLDDAIGAVAVPCGSARSLGAPVAVSANHHSLGGLRVVQRQPRCRRRSSSPTPSPLSTTMPHNRIPHDCHSSGMRSQCRLPGHPVQPARCGHTVLGHAARSPAKSMIRR